MLGQTQMASIIPRGFHSLPLPVVQLSLAAVLKCGQSFRWSIYPLHVSPPSDPSIPTHEYRLCLRDRVVCLRQSPDTLFYRSVFPEPSPSVNQEAVRKAETLAWLKDYFQLDINLLKLYDEWSDRDTVFGKFRDRFEGIRMLRQDPWENLVSFICSSNNNISRITKMVKSLCKQYSAPLISLPPPLQSSDGLRTPPIGSSPGPEQELEEFYPFPPPSRLAEPHVSATLRSLGFGYRADFIQKTAKMLVDAHGASPIHSGVPEPPERWLSTLRTLSTAEARAELLRFMGVGRKVADCILLMSLDKKEVIPVDTHVHQIAMKHYGMRGSSGTKQAMSPKLYDEVNAKLTAIWGDYAGWAHSVLFTADLKSFSSYGLSPSIPSPAKRSRLAVDINALLPTPPATPAPLLAGKKRGRPSRTPTLKVLEEQTVSDQISKGDDDETLPIPSSLAERVKRRRRS
ncbi:hypothetical protein EW146_g7622 [Bondarzewia mesenterica]|uniref:DNA-(apurinic or apyrimidinic site) lyase n=1 Tax=Bondarzewia mesenterica TaxID=1095465 RepID=A0A4V3XE83_9AGAM|nr:hypothetical protein EW146_g7622 [Bondarzewia mesenterica]